MFKLITDKILGFVGINKVTIVLSLLLLASAYSLKESYVVIGKQVVLLEQSVQTTQRWQTLIKERDASLLRRIQERNTAWRELSLVKKQLKDINDETGCLDSNVVPDFRLLFFPYSSSIGSGTMPETSGNLD